MTWNHLAWVVAAAAAMGIGCGGGGAGNSGGGGGGGASSSSSSSSSSSGGGAGGAMSSSSSSSSGAAYEPSGFACSGAKPSWASDVSPILAASCAHEGCHIPLSGAPSGWVFLRGVGGVGIVAEQCSDSRLFIAPGDPEGSYVIHKMTDHNICTGQTMPKDAALMAEGEVQTVYDWICDGAQNN